MSGFDDRPIADGVAVSPRVAYNISRLAAATGLKAEPPWESGGWFLASVFALDEASLLEGSRTIFELQGLVWWFLRVRTFPAVL